MDRKNPAGKKPVHLPEKSGKTEILQTHCVGFQPGPAPWNPVTLTTIGHSRILYISHSEKRAIYSISHIPSSLG